jgi:ribosome biogenesis GTPase
MKGIVIKSTGSWYSVLNENDEVWECRIIGKFRIQEIKSTNPIAVGDRVEFEMDDEERKQGIIHKLFDRDNYIIRKSVNLSKQTQILAANIDQAFLVVTFAKPRTSFGFIDRFLVTSEAYHIPTILIFNKIDIYDSEDLAYVDEVKDMYESIGYPVLLVSALEAIGIEELKNQCKDKTSLFAGHSGVGKSTLVNHIIPGMQLKTTAISDASSKGMHTTTFAEMHRIPNGGFIIDSPGIRELGIVQLEKEEISHYFPEMRELLNDCKFNNCSHTNEPGCAIKRAVDENRISLIRYESYLSILANEDNRN